jgi:hypothetical protein
MPDDDSLLNATTPTDFFVSFLHFAAERRVQIFGLTVVPAENKGERAIRLTVDQDVSHLLPDGKRLSKIESTHILTLTQSGGIIWEINGKETITGLDNIKARLRELQKADEEATRPS